MSITSRPVPGPRVLAGVPPAIAAAVAAAGAVAGRMEREDGNAQAGVGERAVEQRRRRIRERIARQHRAPPPPPTGPRRLLYPQRAAPATTRPAGARAPRPAGPGRSRA